MIAELAGFALLGLATAAAGSEREPLFNTRGFPSCVRMIRIVRGGRSYQLVRCEGRHTNRWSLNYLDDDGQERIASYLTVNREPLRDVAAGTRTFAAHSQRGLAKAIYTAAMFEACQQSIPLVSDDVRSVFSEQMWRTQESRGNAVCMEKGGAAHFVPYGSRVAREGSVQPDPDPDHPRLMMWPCKRYSAICSRPFQGMKVSAKRARRSK